MTKQQIAYYEALIDASRVIRVAAHAAIGGNRIQEANVLFSQADDLSSQATKYILRACQPKETE